MTDSLYLFVKNIWETKNFCDYGTLRYYILRLLHEIMDMPCQSDSDRFFTRSQITIVKEAESIILSDLSKRITAKEMAARFGISESSFKLYIKGILGESYLEIANAVGYENQGKFANVFAKEYGTTPLEFRHLSSNAYILSTFSSYLWSINRRV